jgi:prepilin-type N-terminal cleavage/methylation domain-containing protein
VKHRQSSGVTLIEMMIVVALIGLIVGITFPAVSAGIDTLRMNEASSGIVSFFNDALNRADRGEQVVEITISKAQNMLQMRSGEGAARKLELPQGISIAKILPELQDGDASAPRQFVLYPGGAVPRAGIEIVNQRRARRIVRVDPITGVPQIEQVP